jgi:hypothetical protein
LIASAQPLAVSLPLRCRGGDAVVNMDSSKAVSRVLTHELTANSEEKTGIETAAQPQNELPRWVRMTQNRARERGLQGGAGVRDGIRR